MFESVKILSQNCDIIKQKNMGSIGKEVTSQDHSKDVLYTIKKSDYVGRYIVASRDIQPGETIFSDQPACIGKSLFNVVKI